MTKEECRKEIDRIFNEYTDIDEIADALAELPADLAEEILKED